MLKWKGLSPAAAWDSGHSHHTVVARLEYADGSPADDAAGMLQVVTRIGWEQFSTDLASAVRLVIPGGMASWGGIGVVGKDQLVNDLIAVYTFAARPHRLHQRPIEPRVATGFPERQLRDRRNGIRNLSAFCPRRPFLGECV